MYKGIPYFSVFLTLRLRMDLQGKGAECLREVGVYV